MKAIDNLPVTDLKRLFTYDPESGGFLWNTRSRKDFGVPPSDAVLVKWNAQHAGTAAFTRKTTFGYLYETVLGERLLAHRVAFALAYGRHPTDQIDHANGDRSDNRLSNLREVTNQQNAKNQRRRVTNVSGATGVFWHTHAGKWCAQIRSDGRLYSLGLYDELDAAIAARKAAEARFGFHANHGSETVNPEQNPEVKRKPL